ncbi:endonuclease [Mycolicibacterium mucogenicum]|uniref:Endonuclease n=2 Tax=Mycolicibacterium mucogenicum TaxID=56689 RepID=A0A1A3H8F7_MYCMU|nr:endonuclease [Mycolicibacterium mucogenicum]
MWRRLRRVRRVRRMTAGAPGPAVGIGWRPEIDLTIERLPGVEFMEVIAEGIRPGALPESLERVRSRGITVVPHGISLSLGGAERPESARLKHLGECAAALGAPLVSEHIAFVRAGNREAGHLLPVPRSRAALDVVVANVRIAQDALAVPLALEHVASVVSWPDDELTEAQFLCEIIERTGALLLLDVANLYTSAVNFGADPLEALDTLPLDRIAYVHVAGGALRDGVWHDTHTADVAEPILDLLAELAGRTALPAVMLERDGAYPAPSVLARELAAIRSAAGRAGDDVVRPWAAGLRRASGRVAPEPTDIARRALADAEDALLQALLGLSGPPPGFDADRVAVAGTALAHKRAHTHAKMSLGAKFRRNFAPKLRFDATGRTPRR